MFSTEINHFLQQFDNVALRIFMEFISSLGTVPFVLTFVLGITFALNFKKGIVLVNIVAWTAIFTMILKQQIDFPRPIDVDNSLITQDYSKPTTDLKKLQPSSFFAIFSDELLIKTRGDEVLNYGFPSGHTAIQVALWIGMFFLFRKNWILKFGIIVITLTMLSRLYLAHHFLGDVFGGLTLGLLIVGLIGGVVNQSNYLSFLSPNFKNLAVIWLPAFAIPFVSHISVQLLGCLIGLNIAATFIILQGNTLIFSASPLKRIATAFIIIILIYLSFFAVNQLNISNNLWLSLFLIAFCNFAIFRGSIYLANRFRFLKYKV